MYIYIYIYINLGNRLLLFSPPRLLLQVTAKRAWRSEQKKQNQTSMGKLHLESESVELSAESMAELVRKQVRDLTC